MNNKNLFEKITFNLKNNKFIVIIILSFIIIISILKLVESILSVSDKVFPNKIEAPPVIDDKSNQIKELEIIPEIDIKKDKQENIAIEQESNRKENKYKFQILSDTISNLEKIKIYCNTCLEREIIPVDVDGFFIINHTFRRNQQFKIINITATYKLKQKSFDLDSRDNSHKSIWF